MRPRALAPIASTLALASALAASAAAAPQTRPESRSWAASEIAARDQAPTVFSGHPRLIVGGYRGMSIEALRAACAAPQMRGECDRIGGRHMLDNAMAFLLRGDAGAANQAKQSLLGGISCGDGYERTPAGGYALAYDWLWTELSSSERSRVETNLRDCGSSLVTGLRGNSPHLWHGYTSQASALALIALALDDPGDLRAEAVELFRGNALEAYEIVQGAWPEGYNYLRSHFFSGDPPNQYVIDALRAWDSAVEQDHPEHASIFETVAQEEGDWLRGLAYHHVYGTIPPYGEDGKHTLMRAGDLPTSKAHPNMQVRPFIDSIARMYEDPALAAWGRELEADWAFVGGTGTYHHIHRYGLPYNLPVDVPEMELAEAMAVAEAPLTRIWGRADRGEIISRTGWETASTVFRYGAGKWFTGHQHMDQGHIGLWKNGPLLVDGGVYASWGTEHREAYYIRSVAHNTLLLHMPGETFHEHPRSPASVNDGGQRIHTYFPGSCAQCIQSVAEWRSHLGDGMHFEAGEIEAFEDQRVGHASIMISSDLTSAYNSSQYASPGNVAKVELVQRDVSRIGDSLVVIDRVRTTGDSLSPRAVFHVPTKPELVDPVVELGSENDGVLRSDAGTFSVDNGTGGVLSAKMLYPDSSTIRAIGGPGYRYWVDGANRLAGAENLEGAPAAPGSWRLEVQAGHLPKPHLTADDHLAVYELHVQRGHGMWYAGLYGDVAFMDGDPIDPNPAMRIGFLDYAQLPEAPVDLWPQWLIRSGAVPRAPIRFATWEGNGFPAGLSFGDLVPESTYRWSTTGSPPQEVTASSEGTVFVGPERLEDFVIGHCPPLPGAGADWQALCSDAPPPTSAPPSATPADPPNPTPIPTAPGGLLHRALLPFLERH